MTCLAVFVGVFAAVLTTANAFTVTITNGCSSKIDVYTRLASVYTDEMDTIDPGASVSKTIGKGYEGHFRNGSNDAATLVELSTVGDLDLVWYDIGIIPPRLNPTHEFCSSLQECKDFSESKIGFNTPVQVQPTSNTGRDTCEQIKCLADGCNDAYNFPKDDGKTHSCAFGTDFIVTFCPSGDTSALPISEVQNNFVQEVTDLTPAVNISTVIAAFTAPDSGAGEVPTPNDSVNGEVEAVNAEAIQSAVPTPTAPDVNQSAVPTTTAPDVNQSETPLAEVTPTSTPTSAMSNACA